MCYDDPMSEYLNIWVLGEPVLSIKITNDKQRSVYDRIYSGRIDSDVFVAKQNCPQAPIKRIEI